MNEPALPLETSVDDAESGDTPPPTLDAMPQLEQETTNGQQDESFERPGPSETHESPRLERERTSQTEHTVDDTDGIPLATLGDNTPKQSLQRTTSSESRKSKVSKSKSRSPPLTSMSIQEPSTSRSTGVIQTTTKTAPPSQQLVVPISASTVIQGNMISGATHQFVVDPSRNNAIVGLLVSQAPMVAAPSVQAATGSARVFKPIRPAGSVPPTTTTAVSSANAPTTSIQQVATSAVVTAQQATIMQSVAVQQTSTNTPTVIVPANATTAASGSTITLPANLPPPLFHFNDMPVYSTPEGLVALRLGPAVAPVTGSTTAQQPAMTVVQKIQPVSTSEALQPTAVLNTTPAQASPNIQLAATVQTMPQLSQAPSTSQSSEETTPSKSSSPAKNTSETPVNGRDASKAEMKPPAPAKTMQGRKKSSTYRRKGIHDSPPALNDGKPLVSMQIDENSIKSMVAREIERSEGHKHDILTHIVDGFIIEESIEPFPIDDCPYDEIIPTDILALGVGSGEEVSSDEDDDGFSPPTLAPEPLNYERSPSKSPQQLSSPFASSQAHGTHASTPAKSDTAEPQFTYTHCPQCARPLSPTQNKTRKYCSKECRSRSKTQRDREKKHALRKLRLEPLPQHAAPTIQTTPVKVPTNKPLNTWTVDDVVAWVSSLDTKISAYANAFREEEIDGESLIELGQEHMVRTLNLKLGPALKLDAALKQLKEQQNALPASQ